MTELNDPFRKFFDELGYRLDLYPTLAPAGDVWPELNTYDLYVMWLRDKQHRREAAPHGDFTIHVSDNTRGPNNELAVYVICECGRGYSWERKIPAVELIAWLSNHGPDVPLDEEERRVKAAGCPTVELVAGPAPEPPPHATVVEVPKGVASLVWFEPEEET